MDIGDRVRHSGYAIRPKRDYWLGLGHEPHKSRAKDYLDAFIAERGTVTAIKPADPKRGVSVGIEVQWDTGSRSCSMPYMVEAATD